MKRISMVEEKSINRMSVRPVRRLNLLTKVNIYALSGILCLLLIVLAACGGSANSAASSGNSYGAPSAPGSSNGSNSSSSSSNGQQKSTPDHSRTQYLSKALAVKMQFKDTTSAANNLQNWIMDTDPNASSAGMDYEQTGSNAFNITLTFSVDAKEYTKIQEYLSGYAQQNHGQLVSMKETVQDNSNDYVDSQSQLKNLRTEQTRIQTLMSQAQDLQDTLTLQDKLTGIEGQIEQIEEHITYLTNQVTYYPVTITLQPIFSTTTPEPTPAPAWNLGKSIHDALAASLSFGEGLLTILVWLLAFSIYLIPLVLIIWFAWRWRVGKLHIGGLSKVMPPAPHS
jgi:hypothetical protein